MLHLARTAPHHRGTQWPGRAVAICFTFRDLIAVHSLRIVVNSSSVGVRATSVILLVTLQPRRHASLDVFALGLDHLLDVQSAQRQMGANASGSPKAHVFRFLVLCSMACFQVNLFIQRVRVCLDARVHSRASILSGNWRYPPASDKRKCAGVLSVNRKVWGCQTRSPKGRKSKAESALIEKTDRTKRHFGLTPRYRSRYSQCNLLGQISPKMTDTAIIVSRVASEVSLRLLALSVAIPGLVLAPQNSGG